MITVKERREQRDALIISELKEGHSVKTIVHSMRFQGYYISKQIVYTVAKRIGHSFKRKDVGDGRI